MAADQSSVYGFRKFSINNASIRTREQGIAAILHRLVEAGALQEQCREEVVAAILKREVLGSTAIGSGVAIPHARSSGVATVLGAIAHFRFGLDFDSLDGQPVFVVCLLVSPADQQGQHLRVLEGISKPLRSAS
jgi:PTS system fructose-specific IIA component/PTS system nitrogen regulatory IIA component